MGLVDDKINEIATLCTELNEASIEIAKLEPVSHLSKVQWSGIIGAVQEYRAGNRLEKMMNAPLYKDWSFYQFALHIVQSTKRIVELILDVQKNLTKDDERYYGIASSSVSVIMDAVNAWYHYSPDMAEAEIVIGDEKGALGPSVKASVKEKFAKLDLPDELKALQQPEKSGGGGCFGVLLMLLSVGSIGISALTVLFAVIL